MKKYTIKNYTGNIVESIERFSKLHTSMKVVEAVENGDMLSLTTVDAAEPLEQSLNAVAQQEVAEKRDPIVDFSCKLLMFGVKAHLWHLNTMNEAVHLALKELYEVCDDTADKLLEAEIGITNRPIEHFSFDIKSDNLEFSEYDITEIESIVNEAASLIGNKGINSVVDSFCETCNSVVYKLKRLK